MGRGRNLTDQVKPNREIIDSTFWFFNRVFILSMNFLLSFDSWVVLCLNGESFHGSYKIKRVTATLW